MLTIMNKGANERTPCSQSRQIISARQIQKLTKGDNPVYLAIVWKTNEIPPMKKKNKRCSARAVQFPAAHGMSEGTKRSINKRVGPKKDIITAAEREQEVLAGVPVATGKDWSTLSRSTVMSFLSSCQRAYHPQGRWNIRLKSSLAVNLPTGHHTGWVLLSRTR